MSTAPASILPHDEALQSLLLEIPAILVLDTSSLDQSILIENPIVWPIRPPILGLFLSLLFLKLNLEISDHLPHLNFTLGKSVESHLESPDTILNITDEALVALLASIEDKPDLTS